MVKRKKISYKTLYIKLLNNIIKDLHELRYDYDNRIEAVGDESLKLMTKKYIRKRNKIT